MRKFNMTLTDGSTSVIKVKSLLALAMMANREGWDVESISVYHPKMVQRINLMSGLPYEEPEDTPCYLSPACESYWSM